MSGSVNAATSWATRSSRTRRWYSRLPRPPARIWVPTSSASNSARAVGRHAVAEVHAHQGHGVRHDLADLAPMTGGTAAAATQRPRSGLAGMGPK